MFCAYTKPKYQVGGQNKNKIHSDHFPIELNFNGPNKFYLFFFFFLV